MPNVHATAVVDPAAQLADDAEIGPFCCITGPARIGAGVRLVSHVSINGNATIGDGTIVYPYTSLGFEPQDYKFKPGMETAGIQIGRDCLIREGVTVHAATNNDRPTTVGDRVFLMVNAHVGHDARVHDDAILVNNVCLGGHSEVFEKAIVSGGTVVHQFNRVGRQVMVSGNSVVTQDIPPFCMAAGRNTLVGLNLIGLRRSGMDRAEIDAVRKAYREVFRTNQGLAQKIAALEPLAEQSAAVREMLEFCQGSTRSIASAGKRHAQTEGDAPETDPA